MNSSLLYPLIAVFLLGEGVASFFLMRVLSRKAEQSGGPNLGPLVAGGNLLFAIVVAAVALYLLSGDPGP